MQKPVVIDFETLAIQKRPAYPPVPVGVAIKEPGKKSCYFAWGHPEKNNCTKEQATKIIRGLYPNYGGKRPLLFHNAKFDLDVAEKHLGLKAPAWDWVHDTMFLLFLQDPHASSLSLKPSAERLLGLPPDERDAVAEWLIAHGKIAKNQDPGAFIAQAPADVVGAYAIGDVDRTEKLFDLVYPQVVHLGMDLAYDRERQLLPILLANERRGMRVNLPKLEQDLKVYEAAYVRAADWIRKQLKAPGLNLDSDADMAAALKKAGVVKAFPKTPTGRDSVSKKNLTVDFFSDRRVWLALYYYNAVGTVLTMSMRPWFEEASANGGYIFTQWNQVRQSHGHDKFRGARSGRITCSYFQNVTKTFMDRGDGYEHPAFMGVPELPLVRKYLMPDKGDLWGHVDYNQQEMRLVAHYEEGALAQAYTNNPATDIHQDVRDLIEKVTGKSYERRPVKIVDFRTVYGGGIQGLAEQLHIPYGEARELITSWKRALPDVVALDRELKDRFYQGGHLRTYGGRVYKCKPPAVAKKGPRKGQLISFEYTALNYLIQPSGADVTKEALIRYDQASKHGRLVVSVHDEVNVSVPKKAIRAELKILRDCMESVKLDVPWKSEVKIGQSWGALKKHAL